MDGLIVSNIVFKTNYANAIEVKIYDTRENMFKAIHEWNKEQGGKYQINNDFDAVTLENKSEDFRKINGVDYLIFSTIFFNKEKLNNGIILHECGHAVFNLFRNVLRYTSYFDKVTGSGDDEEEIFCYTLEEYFNKIIGLLDE